MKSTVYRQRNWPWVVSREEGGEVGGSVNKFVTDRAGRRMS